MKARGRIRTYRRLAEAAQAVVVLALPFVTIRGESALRFDVERLTLHVFGASILMDEFFVVLLAVLFVTFAFLLATVVWGRIWCGWGCPQTALLDLTGWFARARRRGGAASWLAHVGVAAVSAVVAANLIWYLVPPREFLSRLAHLAPGPVVGGAWLALTLLVFADLVLVRQAFCATTCPYAKLQGVLLDPHSLVIAYDERRSADCVSCGACVRVCPVGIDIRDGLQAACVACGECVDACAPIMRRLRRAPRLVGHFFGKPGTPRRLLRPAVLALGAASAASLALLVGAGAGREPLEVTVAAASDFAPRRTADGHVYNAYTVTFENRGREPLALRLELTGVARAVLRPDALRLAPGEHRRLRVAAVAEPGGRPGTIVAAELVASSQRGADPVRASRAVPFAVPAATAER